MTHSGDYETVDAPVDERLCEECASRPDLRHPPCPPEGTTAPGDEVIAFAMRAIDIGTRATTWSSSFVVGLDQDCSDRPGGDPVQCTPRNPLTVFERLSNGVDNALATQVFYPILQAEQVSTQNLVNDSLEAGIGGVLLIVDGWNGTPNDDQVGVRLLPAMKTVDGVPEWDGTDRWIAYADRYDPAFPGQHVPDTDNRTADGYVTEGVLVWDARSLSAFLLPFGAGGALVDVRLSHVVVMGDLSLHQRPRRLDDAALSGVWSAFLASRNAVHLAEIIGRCDSAEVQRLTPKIEDLVRESPDMLLPTSSDAEVCDAISVGFLGSWFEIAEVAEILPVSDIPQSCALLGK